MQKETNMAVASMMTCKIGLKWCHMKTLYSFQMKHISAVKFLKGYEQLA